MSGRQAKGEFGTGGESPRSDWFHPVSGGSVQVSGDAANGSKTLGITVDSNQDGDLYSVTECKDGVCPVLWVTTPTRPELQPETINHPSHYVDGAIECIEAIEAQLTAEEYRGYLKGNCVKYLWRERHKGGLESLKKCGWYLDRLTQFDEVNQNG